MFGDISLCVEGHLNIIFIYCLRNVLDCFLANNDGKLVPICRIWHLHSNIPTNNVYIMPFIYLFISHTPTAGPKLGPNFDVTS